MNLKVRGFIYKVFQILLPEIKFLKKLNLQDLEYYSSRIIDSNISDKSKLYPPYKFLNSSIDDFSYVSSNSQISKTKIGKFCSIGPNFTSGWGIHPTTGVSTSPMFYSTEKQNGYSLVYFNKIVERKEIVIGNDVFIGMNVSILDGITIGHGAILGAGAVITKDVPPYAIVGGIPAKVIKFRFNDEIIRELLKIEWWNFNYTELNKIDRNFFDIKNFIKECHESTSFDESEN